MAAHLDEWYCCCAIDRRLRHKARGAALIVRLASSKSLSKGIWLMSIISSFVRARYVGFGALLFAVPASAEPTGQPAVSGTALDGATSDRDVAPLGKPTSDVETATWVGFRQTGPKSALVYVQLTGTVPIESSKVDKRIVVTLSNTKIEVKNNQNPLLAAHFDSVVQSARMTQTGKNVQLEIILKDNASFTSQLVEEHPGAILYVQLVGN